MNIAGILIHAYPGQEETVRNALEAIEGVELHHQTDDGRFIVTVEDAGDTSSGDTVLELHNVPGVACASLAYHSFETDNPNISAEPLTTHAPLTGGA